MSLCPLPDLEERIKRLLKKKEKRCDLFTFLITPLNRPDPYSPLCFLDIGSNIGTFSLMAAAMERKVVAVDAVYSNLALISTR